MEKFIQLNLENNAQCFINIKHIISFETVALNENEKIQSHVLTSCGAIHKVKQNINVINNLLSEIQSSKQEQ
ncbi:hypothetical protein DBR32_04265 [Taibaiella sp. KBW10]|uniref:hypothetical protein n=1 Tax=Taibaiella sp. KBW10 TaxID=2153357 RepID=UPI000F592130|nr:hypothetical protein [Taibaiella sp. KBW10]RQO32022.1 hypothetical protein DBR32_04265 [Taibaiella sp. KBW10]